MKLKEKIKAKFGSIPRFAKLAGLQATDIYRMFKIRDDITRTSRLMELSEICDTLSFKQDENDWKPEYGPRVKAQLKANFGSIKNFIEQYPDFTHHWISTVIHGKKKRFTHKINRLLRVGNIELR